MWAFSRGFCRQELTDEIYKTLEVTTNIYCRVLPLEQSHVPVGLEAQGCRCCPMGEKVTLQQKQSDANGRNPTCLPVATFVSPSCKAMDIEWTTYSGNLVAGTATFVHWPYRSARWMGDFDRTTGTYHKKDEDAVRVE